MPTTAVSTEQRPAPDNATYDVADLAAILKCSTRHVRRMIDARAVPGLIRLGRLVRFHKGIVDEWLTDKAQGVRS